MYTIACAGKPVKWAEKEKEEKEEKEEKGGE